VRRVKRSASSSDHIIVRSPPEGLPPSLFLFLLFLLLPRPLLLLLLLLLPPHPPWSSFSSSPTPPPSSSFSLFSPFSSTFVEFLSRHANLLSSILLRSIESSLALRCGYLTRRCFVQSCALAQCCGRSIIRAAHRCMRPSFCLSVH